MKLLRIIKGKNIFPGSHPRKKAEYRLRKAARAIVFDKENKIALLNVSKCNYYKLPGGGVEKFESLSVALQRECLEEIGCQIKIKSEIGRIIEYRDRFNLRQESFCYLAKVVGKKGKSHFEPGEIKEGFRAVWVKPGRAIKLIEESQPKTYDGKFIVVRDLEFITEAKKLFPNRL